MTISLFVLIFVLASSIIGYAICSSAWHHSLRQLSPLLGLSVVTLWSSTALFLGIPSSVGFGVVLLMTAVGSIRIIQRGLLFEILSGLFSLLLTLSLLWLPYGSVFGFQDVITGYHTSNDAVMHALLSRGFDTSSPIVDKLFPSGAFGSYPLGSHSIIYLVSSLPNVDVRPLVYTAALIFLAFSVFPLQAITRQGSSFIGKLPGQLTAAFASASYYNVAMAYHGFLPQVSCVAFILGALVSLEVIRKEGSNVQGIGPLLVCSIFSAAAIACYSFTAFVCLGIGLVLIPIGMTLRAHVRVLLLVSLLCALALGGNYRSLLPFASSVVSHILGIGSSSPEVQQFGVFGNLVGYLSPLMWSGIWWEIDYRRQNLADIGPHLAILSALAGFLVAAIGLRRSTSESIGGARLLAVCILSYISILLLTKSPYSVSKVGSLIAPLITVLMLEGGRRLPFWRGGRYGIVGVLACGICLSNINLMRHISTLPGSVIDAMGRIREDYANKRLLIYSGNDWLLYALDRPEVDIVGLHYLPDKVPIPIDLGRYNAVVFDDGASQRANVPCIGEVSYGPFTVCEIS